MERKFFLKCIFGLSFLFFCDLLPAQPLNIIKKCGGSVSGSIPVMVDNDQDGLSDTLEQLLLSRFLPTFIQFSDESCSGSSINTSSLTDTNLAVCRVFPVPQQYVSANDASLLLQEPVALINEQCLSTGLVWFENHIIINGAVLYGRDCGLNGHTADVEGFSFSIRYIGVDNDSLWRYDTVMAHWEGATIQTVSHAGTFCQQIETFPYKSIQNVNGKDTVFISPDKHGNYLTIPGCNSSIICNPGCNNTQLIKHVLPINAGEEASPFIADLGLYYSGYAGENPWSDTSFLNGGAGTIKAKMMAELRSDFISGEVINSCQNICTIYNDCFGCTNGYDACNAGCDTITTSAIGCSHPLYDCSAGIAEEKKRSVLDIFPNPAEKEITVVLAGGPIFANKIKLINMTGSVVRETMMNSNQQKINTSDLSAGIYLLQVTQNGKRYEKKLMIK